MEKPMEFPNQNTALNKFLELVKPFKVCKPLKIRDDMIVKLRDEIISKDNQAIFEKIKQAAKDLNGTMIQTPSLGFIIPLSPNVENDTALLYLHESQIEDGGPQPRIEIRPDDPETVSLFESIKEKGQLAPIFAVPSPTSPVKYRIYEGHRRRMVIFNMLRKDGIWAIIKNLSEQEAYENAFTLNYERKSLTPYELGAYLLKLREKYPDVNTQEKLGNRLGLSQDSISLILRTYNGIVCLKGKIEPEITNQFVKMPASKIDPILHAPEEAQPTIAKIAVKKKLSRREIKMLAKEVNAIPNADASAVEEKAKELFEKKEVPTVEDKVNAFLEEGIKIQRKSDQLLDKLIDGTVAKMPERFVKDLYGRVVDGKITVEKASAFASTWVDMAYELLRSEGKLDFVFEEAAKW